MGRWILFLPFCLFIRDASPVARPDTVALGEESVGKLGPLTDPMERLRQTDPLAFLEQCLERSQRDVHGYTANFLKRELVQGKLLDPEEIEVAFREKPFSVYMNWMPRTRQKVLYIRGQNDGKLLAWKDLPFGFVPSLDINGILAKAGSRYTVDQFGIVLGMERGVVSMKEAKARGKLHLKYLGEVNDARLGDVTCYKFVRKPFEPLEDEKLYELVLYIDKVTGLQIGSILKDPGGELIAEYFFRNVQVNPTFPDYQFTRAVFDKK